MRTTRPGTRLVPLAAKRLSLMSVLFLCAFVGSCDSGERSKTRVQQDGTPAATTKARGVPARKVTPESVKALVGKRVIVTLTFGGDPIPGRILSAPEWDRLRGDHLFEFHRDDMQQPGRLRVSDVRSIREAN